MIKNSKKILVINLAIYIVTSIFAYFIILQDIFALNNKNSHFITTGIGANLYTGTGQNKNVKIVEDNIVRYTSFTQFKKDLEFEISAGTKIKNNLFFEFVTNLQHLKHTNHQIEIDFSDVSPVNDLLSANGYLEYMFFQPKNFNLLLGIGAGIGRLSGNYGFYNVLTPSLRAIASYNITQNIAISANYTLNAFKPKFSNSNIEIVQQSIPISSQSLNNNPAKNFTNFIENVVLDNIKSSIPTIINNTSHFEGDLDLIMSKGTKSESLDTFDRLDKMYNVDIFLPKDLNFQMVKMPRLYKFAIENETLPTSLTNGVITPFIFNERAYANSNLVQAQDVPFYENKKDETKITLLMTKKFDDNSLSSLNLVPSNTTSVNLYSQDGSFINYDENGNYITLFLADIIDSISEDIVNTHFSIEEIVDVLNPNIKNTKAQPINYNDRVAGTVATFEYPWLFSNIITLSIRVIL